MIISSAGIAPGSVLTAEVAVIGSGPAGIVTALELAESGVDVVLIESGNDKADPVVQRLADTEALDEERHAPMHLTTTRRIGGASNLWGGKCVPYDRADFDRRPYVPDGVWPLGYEDVAPLFGRACEWFFCGRPVFDADDSEALAGRSIVPGFPEGEVTSTSLERWSLPTNFGRHHRERLARCPQLRMFTGLTCTRIVPAHGPEARVASIEVKRIDGVSVDVRAAHYVLACGGLETTRILLASPAPDGRAIGDHSGHLGRWYMAHLEGFVSHVRFATPPAATIYDYERDTDGVFVRRRLAFARDVLHRERLPNVVFWLANPQLADPAHGSGILSFVYLALTSPLGPWLAPEAQRRSLAGEHIPGAPYGSVEPGSRIEHARNVLRELAPTLGFASRFAWRRFVPRRRAPGFFVAQRDNRYPLEYHGEHLPHGDSMVSLGTTADALGVPRLRIDLRFTAEDVDGIVRAHQYLDAHLRASGIGGLEFDDADVAGAVLRQSGGGFHQVGTTRMSAEPADGVVDRDLRVHGWNDLSVASSSVFPTSGQANSTFMIVVFAVRLAQRLRSELRSGAVIGAFEGAAGRPT